MEEINLNAAFEDPSLKRFCQIYGNSLRVHPIWQLENTTRGNRTFLRDFARLNGVITSSDYNKVCVYCNDQFSDYLDHYIHECNKYTDTREYFWSLLINVFSVMISSYLYNLEQSEMTEIILGKTPNCAISNNEQWELLALSAKAWQLLVYECELKLY